MPKKKTHEEFIKEVSDLVGDEYQGSREKILFLHKTCSYYWKIAPDTFINGGVRCPKCTQSKGNNTIFTILKENNINFQNEFRFFDCRNKNPLPFDFAIFDKNNNISLLIEYDGIQHFEPTFGDVSFKITQYNDNIKNEYCKKNNIKLIRIPYWEFDNLEKIILDNCLNNKLVSCL